MKDYLEVRVRILPLSEPAQGESGATGTQRTRYRVVVDADGGGQVERTLELPFALSDLAGAVAGVARMTRDAGEVTDTHIAAGPSVREFGEMLFDAVFKDEARDQLIATIAVAGNKPDTGTRIRLLMNLEGPGMAEVASLPWELMRIKGKDPLVVSVRTPLVRSPDVDERSEPRPFQRPLRIMAIMANPVGTLPLNLDEEKVRIEKEWASLPGVKVDFPPPVEEEIKRMLALAEYHVVHFMGHGAFDAAGGALLLENRDRSVHRVTGEEFARWLESEPLRLVFLNACNTAKSSARSDVNPFAGVATALMKKAAPAVVAMQFPISDNAAIAFAKIFYARIADGIPVDAAVSMARAELLPPQRGPSSAPQREPSEWATPVLFMRSKNGRLFELSDDADAAEQGSTAVNARTTVAPPTPAVDPWGDGPADAPRVFLAAPSDDLRKWHKQLIRELGNAGVRVIHTLTPTVGAKEHAASVTSIVRSADLCVHLIGDDPGEEIDGEPSGGKGAPMTYAYEQCRIGLEAARAQLILMDEAMAVESTEQEHPAWSAYVKSLLERPRVAARFRVVRTNKNRMTDEILAVLKELKEARQAALERGSAGGTVRSAFVDAHRTDFKYAQALETFLVGRNIDVEKKTSGDSPSAALEQFDVNLSKFPLYILVAGDADKAWVENREVAALRSAARSKAKILIGRYAARTDAPENAETGMRLFEVVAEMNGFDASSVETLIGSEATPKS